MTWVAVFTLLLGFYVAGAVFRREDRRDADQLRARLAELEVRFADALPQGDPYRKKILPMLEPARQPVYCVDCRFKKIGVNNDAICLAQPTKGKYLIIGQGQTNADHDCAHFQKREPS